MRVTDFKVGRIYSLPNSYRDWFCGKHLKIYEHDILLNIHGVNRGSHSFNYPELMAEEWYEVREISIEDLLEEAKRIIIGLCFQYGKTIEDEKGEIKEIWHGFMGALEDAFEFLHWEDQHTVSKEEYEKWLQL